MRWGVRDDAQDDHQTTGICLKQVENCYKTSRGPYLAIFLGNKYGYRPYPNTIPENEYEILYEEVDKFNTSLLNEWFLLDENMVPPSYRLQPITSKFPHYNDESEENAKLQETDRESWKAVDTLLTNIFREAATKANQKGLIDEDTMHKYHRSVTEAEINAGLLSKEDSQDRVFCFIREFTEFNLNDDKAKRYSDLDGNDFDEEAMELLKNLKEKTIPSKLSKENIHYCTIPWMPGGVTPENETHKEYLHRSGKIFKDMIMKQVAATFKSKTNYGMVKGLYQEVLHHSTFCVNKVKTFSGREDLLAEIKKKVMTVGSDSEAREEKEMMLEEKKEKMRRKMKEKEQRQKAIMMQAAAKGKMDMEGLVDELDSEGETSNNDDDDNNQKLQEMDAVNKHLSSLGIKFSMEERESNPSEKLMEELEMLPLEEFTHPLVLYGTSGCGKTALMAKLASHVDSWFTKPIVKIIRFLGTSPKSNNLRTMLLFLCKQIWHNYSIQNQEEYDLDKDIAVLVLYFHALLRKIDSDSKPLVIILDSLDQLDGSDNAFSMMWLPKKTPANVFIIVSMLPHVPKIKLAPDVTSKDEPAPVMCLDNAMKNLGENGHFVEVPSLPESTAEDIMAQWMTDCNQTLTDKQLQLIFHYFRKEPQPLYLKLCHDQSKLWKSYTPREQCVLGKTIQAAIEKLFSDLEIQHGHILVSKALGYLTAAKHGLTDTELEDILSLDDEVLQDTYLYHLPPDPMVIRLPPLLWQRIRGDLGEFLVEREADGFTVFNWYHRQFIQVARMKYVFSSESYAQDLHGMLADFFVGTWSETPKPIELYKKKKGSYPEALRQVQAQPNCFEDNRYNFRKLAELPFHLTLSGRADDLVKLTVNDLGWLYTKAKAKGIQEVLNDFQFARTTFLSQGLTEDAEVVREIEQLYRILILRSDALWKDPNSLPLQLLGQLGMNKEPETPGLAKLLQECWTWCETTSSPALTPTNRCLPYPEPSVKMTLNICIANLGDPSENERKCAVSENGQILYAVDKQKQGLGDLLKVFDMAKDNQIIRVVPLKGMDVKTITSIAGKYLHIVLYVRRDKYEPDLKFKLFNESLVLPSGVREEDEVRGVSPSGDLAFVLHPKPGNDKKDKEEEAGDFTFQKKSKTSMDPFLVNLSTGARSQLPKATADALAKDAVKHAVFSSDEKYLLVDVAGNGGVVIDVKSKDVIATILPKAEKSFSFSRGSAEHHVSEQTTRILSNNKVLMSSPVYKQYVSLCDLQTGEKIHDLWRKGIDMYSCDKMAVNRAENLVAVATSSGIISNGHTKKDCVVWNLLTGKVHAVIPNSDGWISWIGFCGPEDEYIVCCHDLSKRIVDLWYVGTVDDPLPYPQAIYVLDLNSVSQIVRFFSNVLDGSYFVTASIDNIVTFHNMKYLDAKCKKVISEKIEELINKFADGANQEELDELMGIGKEQNDEKFGSQDMEKSENDFEVVHNEENGCLDTEEVQNDENGQDNVDENTTGNNEDKQDTDEANDQNENQINENEEETKENENILEEENKEATDMPLHTDSGKEVENESEMNNKDEEEGQGEIDNDGRGDELQEKGGDKENTNHIDLEGDGQNGQEKENGGLVEVGEKLEVVENGETKKEPDEEEEEMEKDDLNDQLTTVQEDQEDANLETKDNGKADAEEDDKHADEEIQNGGLKEKSVKESEKDEKNKDDQDGEGDKMSRSGISEDTDSSVMPSGQIPISGGGYDDFEEGENEVNEEDQVLPETDEPLPMPGQARIKSTCLALTKDGMNAVVGTSDGWVVFIDLETGKVIAHQKQGQNNVQNALATSTGKYVVTTERKAVVWNTGTWDKYLVISARVSIYGGSPNPSDIAEARDILVVAVSGMECFGYVWNLETKQMMKKLPGLYGFSNVVITSDAKKVVTTFFDFPVVMSLEGEGSEDQLNMAQVDTMMAGCSCLCLSPDDRLVLAGSTDGSVRVMEIESGKFIFRMQHLSSVKQAAFSPDGRHMITGGFRSILIWSTQDGSLVTSLANHQEFIESFCFSEDGKFLISGSLDKRIIVWDFLNHSSITSFFAHCPVSLMRATKDLSTVVYCPENIDYLAIMHPNPALKKILAGEKLEVPEIVQRAQALALAFTAGSVKKATSRSCSII